MRHQNLLTTLDLTTLQSFKYKIVQALMHIPPDQINPRITKIMTYHIQHISARQNADLRFDPLGFRNSPCSARPGVHWCGKTAAEKNLTLFTD